MCRIFHARESWKDFYLFESIHCSEPVPTPQLQRFGIARNRFGFQTENLGMKFRESPSKKVLLHAGNYLA